MYILSPPSSPLPNVLVLGVNHGCKWTVKTSLSFGFPLLSSRQRSRLSSQLWLPMDGGNFSIIWSQPSSPPANVLVLNANSACERRVKTCLPFRSTAKRVIKLNGRALGGDTPFTTAPGKGLTREPRPGALRRALAKGQRTFTVWLPILAGSGKHERAW
jgi:hypothetical protein